VLGKPQSWVHNCEVGNRRVLPPDETLDIARANFEPAYRYLSQK
jgi:hypothetical protein